MSAPATGSTMLTTNAGEYPYTVRIAPSALEIIVRRAVEQVPGVARISSSTPASRLLPHSTYAHEGVRLALNPDAGVRVAVNVVLDRWQNLRVVGADVQDAVASAMENLVGLPTEAVDIYVQDVD